MSLLLKSANPVLSLEPPIGCFFSAWASALMIAARSSLGKGAEGVVRVSAGSPRVRPRGRSWRHG
jgi:hypothetical protein